MQLLLCHFYISMAIKLPKESNICLFKNIKELKKLLVCTILIILLYFNQVFTICTSFGIAITFFINFCRFSLLWMVNNGITNWSMHKTRRNMNSFRKETSSNSLMKNLVRDHMITMTIVEDALRTDNFLIVILSSSWSSPFSSEMTLFTWKAAMRWAKMANPKHIPVLMGLK